jgi:hypothetical protein
MSAPFTTGKNRRRGHGPRRGSTGAALALLALLGLGGCLPTGESVTTRDVRFEGVVRSAGTSTPVQGALVEVWLNEPAPRADEPPSLTGQTGATGAVVLEGRFRSAIAPRFLGIRVTPPAGSGLAVRTVGGGENEELFRMEESSRTRVTYTAEIQLQSAAP